MTDPDAFPAAIDPAELARRRRVGDRLTILDVRDRDAFEAWTATGPTFDAVQVPHQRFVAARVTGTTADLVADHAAPFVVVCAEGAASDEVAADLRGVGLAAANLTGGLAAWGQLYESVAVECDDALPAGVEVVQYRRPATGCLSYLVVAGDEAAVVDPLAAFADRYRTDAADRGATLRLAIDTHVHADHWSGVHALAESGATAVVPAGARDRGLAWDGGEEPRFVADGDAVSVGDATLSVAALPGHTSEAVGVRLGETLLGGDLLFAESVARPDLESGGDAARRLAGALHDSLSALDDDERLLPGHYDLDGDAVVDAGDGAIAVRVGTARERVGLLGLDRAAFVDRVAAADRSPPANHERLVAVNLRQEAVDPDTAAELELGPNNCAATPAE